MSCGIYLSPCSTLIEEKAATQWLPPSTFPRKGYGIIFFDELNLAPNLVQASAYQFILDRGLGEYLVPEGYAVFAAGNRLEDRHACSAEEIYDELPKPAILEYPHQQFLKSVEKIMGPLCKSR